MKRHTETCSQPKTLKRQKSNKDNFKHCIEEVYNGDKPELEREDNQGKNVNKSSNSHGVLQNLNDADTANVKAEGTKNKHKKTTNATITKRDATSDKAACETSDTVRSKNGRHGHRREISYPGFGFTSKTSQYRCIGINKFSENGQDKSCTLKGNVSTKYVEKTILEKTKKDYTNDPNSCSNGDTPKIKSSALTESDRKQLVISCIKNEQEGQVQQSQSDLEMDVINTTHVNEVILDHAPRKAPADFVRMNPKKMPVRKPTTLLCLIPIGTKAPDDETDIVIPHPNADRPEGDDFGAKLCTFIDVKHRPMYFRHFFVGKITGPAKVMGIRKNDELVLIGEIFVPEITHNAVLNLFHHVQVDGKTRFSMVIRREVDENWQWIESSAVLTPEKTPDKGPVIKPVEYKRLKEENGTVEISISRHLYKVPGTQKYLEISNKNVYLDVFKQDETDAYKIILKRCRFWPSNHVGQIEFAAALCDSSMTRYIAMDKTRSHIVLKNSPMWFKLITLGSNVRFQLKDQYIGYNRENGNVKAQTNDCVFEEFPASALKDMSISFPTVTDHLDGNFPSQTSSFVMQGLDEDMTDQATACGLQELDSDTPNQASASTPQCLDIFRHPFTSPLQDRKGKSTKQTTRYASEDAEPDARDLPKNENAVINDDNDSLDNYSMHSNEDQLNLSKSSNNSDMNDANIYGKVSMETDSSGYSSSAQSPPDSLGMDTRDDLVRSCFEKQHGNFPKTPTTPMSIMKLSGKL